MKRCTALGLVVGWCLLASSGALAREKWTPEQARQWQERMPWLVGSNFGPASAINQLEMWQSDTFDPHEIDEELGWAEGLGFNSMRVFLHHLPYEADSEGFQSGSISSLPFRTSITSERCWCCSTACGIRTRSWGNSTSR